MTVEPVLCISTNLDRLQIDALRIRYERVIDRLTAGGSRLVRLSVTNGIEMRDPHGTIAIHSLRNQLILRVGPTDGLGASEYEMPLPIELHSKDHAEHKVTEGGIDGVMPYLQLWKRCIDAEKASTVTYLDLGGSGFTRLLEMVSSVVATANPAMKPRARINFRCSMPYEPAPDMMGHGDGCHLGVVPSGTRVQPILSTDVTRTLLDLHRGMSLESAGGRIYRLRPLQAMQATLPQVPVVEAMRWLVELGLRPDRRIVLKAGMEL